ncbi:MAG: hypothetical protein BRD23_05445 [Halobacteriales archaeon SW_9_67_25]|nr:MAG: hypothetical protein BRD23_05445 [Halobacteriales archaeon SW_9_67_25]
MAFIGSDLPKNDGFYRPFETVTPEGSMVNPVEAVTLRVTGEVPTPPLCDEADATEEATERGTQAVYFGAQGTHETDVYWRPALPVGTTVEGPVLLEGTGSTAIVPPDATATVTDDGSILVELTSSAAE